MDNNSAKDNSVFARQPLIKGALKDKLGILLCAMIVMLFAVGMLTSILPFSGASRNGMLLNSALQNVLCFILPAWLTAYLCTTSPSSYLGLGRSIHWRQVLGIFVFMVCISPAMNAVVEWNEHVHLPAFMWRLEETMRAMEENAAEMTNLLVGDSSVWGLVSGLLFVGILTGLGEEAFFRAGLQKAMTSSGINRHVAVWVTAFIFSAIHFQFFGFVPRMLLGAMFGYFYLSSGSLWVAAAAHALNNSSVVVMEWLAARGIVETDFETWGASSPWLVATSVCLGVIFVIMFWKPLISKNGKEYLRRDSAQDNR